MLQMNITIFLCSRHVLEDWSHLFFECSFSLRIWTYLQIYWGSRSEPEMLKEAKNKDSGALLC
jgi:hypothetical protein